MLACPITAPQMPGLDTVWDALEDFGAYEEGARWVPYWENDIGNWRRGLAVSYYENDGRYFMVLFNPHFDAAHSVTVPLRELGVSTVEDVIEGKTSQPRRLNVQLSPRGLKLLRLR